MGTDKMKHPVFHCFTKLSYSYRKLKNKIFSMEQEKFWDYQLTINIRMFVA